MSRIVDGALPSRARVGRWLPGVRTAAGYRPGWLRYDLVAGLVLTAMLVPQGMAYAELAGLPPVTGLYATMAPLLAYAVFGPSRILVMAPDSAVAPMVAAAVIPLAAPGDPAERVALAGMLALLVGVFCVAGGIARVGFVTDLLSKPVRVGYLNGIALTVIISQLPTLFGFSVEGEKAMSQLRGFVEGLDAADVTAFAIGVSCLTLILVVRRAAPMVPAMLVAVVAATGAVAALGLDVPVVGPLPSGLPSFVVPSVDTADLGRLTVAALGIAFVAFADTSVLSRSYASKLGERVDQNQELVALGASNVAAGVFGGFPLSSSSSRTPVAETSGARTQLTGVVGAVAIGILLVAAPSLTANLPSAALAAVVIAAAISLADPGWVVRLYRVRRSEFMLSTACFLAVLLAGVLWGIAIAVGLSLLNVVRRAWRPYDAVLGRADGLKGYHDTTRHPEARLVPGLLIYRFDAPLFFANADVFRDRLLDLVRSRADVRRVCVAAEAMTDVDVTAAGVLADLVDELRAEGIDLVFAEMKGPVKDRLASYGLAERIGTDRFYPTIGVAVRRHVEETGVAWRDWEDRAE